MQLLRIDDGAMNAEFAGWCLHQLHRSGIVERLQHQTTQMRNLDFRDYLRVLLPKPPRDEQNRIAEAISLAARVASKQREQAQAVRTMKTALVDHIFRTGVSSDREFTETRIGRFPSSWTIRTIRSVLAEPPSSGISPQSHPDPPGTPILNVSCIKTGVCDPRLVTYVDATMKEMEENRAEIGDFFVLRGNGNREYVATGGVVASELPANCIFSDKLIRLRFDLNEVAAGFIPWLWQSESFLRRLQSKAESGSGLWMMSKRDIVREIFACPPLDEQRRIVELLTAARNFEQDTAWKADALRRLSQSLRQQLLTGRIRLPEMASV